MLQGGDLIGSARTGSGKTAAFGLPLLDLVAEDDGLCAVVLTPTRELCMQVATALRSYSNRISGLSIATIYGGAPYPPQIRSLREGARVVVGTPGRVIDHLKRGTLRMDRVRVFVLDEADQMLQMGFIDEVNEILDATPDNRQIALFSATMPPAIKRIAERYLTDPMHVRPEAARTSVDHVKQCFMIVPNQHKMEALQRFLRAMTGDAVLVFARTRVMCADLAENLQRRGLAVEALHGDMAQAARERVVAKLRSGKTKIVVGTDVAARGLDVDHLTHVINLDLPMNAETYVHRIGRTARAGRDGMAVSFVTPAERRKIAMFARQLNADIEPISVPSDAQIAARERKDLVDAIEAMSADSDGAQSLFETIVEQTGWDAQEIALRALQALANKEQIPLNTSPSEEPPRWGKVSGRRERQQREMDGPVSELMVHAGRRDGIRPGDIVASLTNNFDVPANAIGRITLVASRIFVSMSAQEIERVCREHETMPLRGRDVRIEPNDAAPPRKSGRRGGGNHRQGGRFGRGTPRFGGGGGKKSNRQDGTGPMRKSHKRGKGPKRK
ncbi:MAG: hypothetical protein CMH53_07350 [Myxococcales bacterium]|nr:hypothetical protein [Myxococcales bacterium]